MLNSKHRGKTALAIAVMAAALQLVPLHTARADDFELPTAQSLGFSEEHAYDDQGRWVSRYHDLETGYVITSAERPLVGVREETILDAGGNAVYRAEIHPEWRRMEGTVPTTWATEVRALADGRFQVSDVRRKPGGGYVTRHWISDESAWQCNEPPPIADAQLKALLASTAQLVPFVPDVADAGKSLVRVGSNTVVKNCDRFGTKGVESLSKMASEALNTGLRCLAGLKTTHPGPLTSLWRAHVAQLLGYFAAGAPRPFTIVCESTSDPAAPATDHIKKTDTRIDAFALTCIDERTKGAQGDPGDYPGMAINLAGPSIADPEYTKAHIFHELVHHLGYFHDVGAGASSKILYDAVYGAQRCCFPGTITAKTAEKRKFYQDFECRALTHQKHGSPDE